MSAAHLQRLRRSKPGSCVKDKLIAMWLLAMHDPTLCSEAKAHVEAVLGAEFRCWP